MNNGVTTTELDLEKFKRFTMSDLANKKFRNMMLQVKTEGKHSGFLPNDFGTLLDYLCTQTKREKAANFIDQNKFNSE